MKNLALFMIVSVLLNGCATTYKPNSFWNDGGFSETELQPNIFRISFKGNEMLSDDKVSDYLMLRAAEVCDSRNKPFMKLENSNSKKSSSGYIPAVMNVNSFGNGSGMITSVPAFETFETNASALVTCLDKKTQGTWDTKFLVQSLKTKYNIK